MNKDAQDADSLLKSSLTFPDEFFREIFAAAALSGLLARDREPRTPETLARLAYEYADGMLASAARRSTPQ